MFHVSMLKQMNELSQAYKYLANFYLKKQKLDNAHEAASKCLEFAEVTFAIFFLFVFSLSIILYISFI